MGAAPNSLLLCFSKFSNWVCRLDALYIGVELLFSTFLLSRVTDCRTTSNLAEVKLLFLASSSDNEGSAGQSWSVSSSSLEPEDLLRIESDSRLHPMGAPTR